MARRKRALEVVETASGRPTAGATASTSSSLAYQQDRGAPRRIASCKPGQFATMLELQQITGFGRTPVHHRRQPSFRRHAQSSSRRGLHVAPIDRRASACCWTCAATWKRFVHPASRRIAPACPTAIRRCISSVCCASAAPA